MLFVSEIHPSLRAQTSQNKRDGEKRHIYLIFVLKHSGNIYFTGRVHPRPKRCYRCFCCCWSGQWCWSLGGSACAAGWWHSSGSRAPCSSPPSWSPATLWWWWRWLRRWWRWWWWRRWTLCSSPPSMSPEKASIEEGWEKWNILYTVGIQYYDWNHGKEIE